MKSRLVIARAWTYTHTVRLTEFIPYQNTFRKDKIANSNFARLLAAVLILYGLLNYSHI
jgi:hypothetical protein